MIGCLWATAIVLTLVAVSGCKRGANTLTPPTSAKTERNAASGPARDDTSPDLSQVPSIPREKVAGDPTDSSLFVDIAEESGIKFSYNNGRSAGEFAIIESLGGGLAAFDYDLDGRLDVMFAGGGQLDNRTVSSRPSGLYHNAGTSPLQFLDATAAAHAAADAFFTHGIYPGDFDSDGFDDLALSGYGGVQLGLNQGDGTFQWLPPLTGRLGGGFSWSSSLAWADLDGNGLLDLYVANYVDWNWDNHPVCPGQGGVEREVCAPREFSALPDVVYMNHGSLELHAVAEELGLAAGGKGLGVVVGDVNGDHLVDVYVANDTTDNYLYINDGQGRFTESAVLASVSGDDAGVSTGSMGLCFFDANADSLPDILVTNFERELSALYRNEGQGFFTYASRQAGFAAYPAGSVGFGTVCLDYDFDGDQDLVVANGHVSYQSPHAPYRQLAHVFENNQGQFKRLPAVGYFGVPRTGRGIATGDFDNDGAVDLAVSHLEEPVAVLQASHAPACHWASLQLVGTTSNRSAIGATVTIEVDGQSRIQFLVGGGSYLSHSDRRKVVYWSDTAAKDEQQQVTIRWPSGEEERFVIVASQTNTLVQGTGQ
ncbi:MAG: CRTAC1 family protein [Pirellulaceae bacterium]